MSDNWAFVGHSTSAYSEVFQCRDVLLVLSFLSLCLVVCFV